MERKDVMKEVEMNGRPERNVRFEPRPSPWSGDK